MKPKVHTLAKAVYAHGICPNGYQDQQHRIRASDWYGGGTPTCTNCHQYIWGMHTIHEDPTPQELATGDYWE